MSRTPTEESIKAVDTIEGHQQFIRSQWRQLAAFAWSRYRSEGRGAVVIDLRRCSQAASGLRIPSYYVSESGEGLTKRGGWPNDEVAEAVREYDPALEVLFIVLRLDGDLLYYMVSDDPAPPQADALQTGGAINQNKPGTA